MLQHRDKVNQNFAGQIAWFNIDNIIMEQGNVDFFLRYMFEFQDSSLQNLEQCKNIEILRAWYFVEIFIIGHDVSTWKCSWIK
jgi:hypothetical protein